MAFGDSDLTIKVLFASMEGVDKNDVNLEGKGHEGKLSSIS